MVAGYPTVPPFASSTRAPTCKLEGLASAGGEETGLKRFGSMDSNRRTVCCSIKVVLEMWFGSRGGDEH
jgi:hypothetical protein